MKTAYDFLKSNGMICERESGAIAVLHFSNYLGLVNVLNEYAIYYSQGVREKLVAVELERDELDEQYKLVVAETVLLKKERLKHLILIQQLERELNDDGKSGNQH